MTETAKYYVVDVVTEGGEQIGDSGILEAREEAFNLYESYISLTSSMTKGYWTHGQDHRSDHLQRGSSRLPHGSPLT